MHITPVDGTTLDAGAPTTVASSSEIPDDVWLELGESARLTSKHPHSTRETTFAGPGRFRTCVGHGEEAWIGEGGFESVASSGERPGAEEWVVTPVGVVRYGAAKLEIHVTPATATTVAKAEVKVTGGSAYAWTGDRASPGSPAGASPVKAPAMAEGWVALEGGRTLTLAQSAVSPPGELARVAVDRCTLEAKGAKELAFAVASPDASLTQVAPRHVIARHLARAACDVAWLRVGQLPPSPARDDFSATLKQAEIDWKTFRSRPALGPQP